MKFIFDSRVTDFFGDITILPEQMKFAGYLAHYSEEYLMTLQDFIVMDLDELYRFTESLNEWLVSGAGPKDSKYSPVYIRSFQGYIKKAVQTDSIDKAFMDSALIDHAVRRLVDFIDDDSFDERNLVGFTRSETDSGTSVKKQKFDKLKAIEILLRYAGGIKSGNDKSGNAKPAPSTALTNLMQSLIGDAFADGGAD